MIGDGCPDTNRKVLVKRVGEHLLPTAQPRVVVANPAEGCIEASDQPFVEGCGLP
jgi:hypothetical protein